MPRYQIKDNQTGKTVVIEGATPPTETDAEQIFKDAGLRTQVQEDKPFFGEGLLREAGLGPIVDITGGLGESAMQVGDIYKGLTGTPEEKKQAGKSFIERQTKQQKRIKNLGYKIDKGTADIRPTAQTIRQTAGTAMTVAPVGGSSIPTMFSRGIIRGVGSELSQPEFKTSEAIGKGVTGGILEALPGIFPYLTKKGTAKLTEKAVSEATKKGKVTEWGDIAREIEREVYQKLGKNKQITKSITQITLEKAPTFTPGIPKKGYLDLTEVMTPSQLLDWRRQITARQGSGIFQALFGNTTIDDKVANIARNVISKNIKNVAPGTKIPDYLYSIYSKGGKWGGDVPTWLKRLLIYETIRRMFGSTIGGAIQKVSQ